jgi:hypothetical protein
VFTIASVFFFLLFLLPVAIWFQHRAFAEAEASGGRYVWRRTVWNRPLLLLGVWLLAATATVALLLLTGVYPGGE